MNECVNRIEGLPLSGIRIKIETNEVESPAEIFIFIQTLPNRGHYAARTEDERTEPRAQ